MIEFGLGAVHCGAGVPLPETVHVRVTALLKPLVALIDTVEVVDAPAETLTGDVALSEKLTLGEDMTKATEVLWLTEAEVPVTATS